MNNLNSVLSRAKKSIKNLLQHNPQTKIFENSFAVDISTTWGYVDSVAILSVGVLRLVGWVRGDIFTIPVVNCNLQEVPLRNHYRIQRTDLPGNNYSLGGIVFEYDLHHFDGAIVETVEINGLAAPYSTNCRVTINRPHYEHLLSSDTVYSRDDIYTSGLPTNEAPPHAFEVIKDLPTPMLDFGCGRGNLVHLLRQNGMDCWGIELEREQISAAIIPDIISYVRLYDGSLPLPYQTEQFRTVFSFEVLEHVANYDTAISELARITGDYAVFSVPDISSIPLCHPKNVVPWHLLEGTHINFFTQQSFEKTLKKYFGSVMMAKVGFNPLTGADFFTSLLAVCRK